MDYKIITINLVGSNLYNLQGPKSDLDYVMLYRRNPQDYITTQEYKTTMPDGKMEGRVPVNYKYWDIMKYLQLAGVSSWGAFELLYCLTAYHQKPLYQYLLSEVRKENFQQKTLLYHSKGVINSDHHRGYMKAFHFLFMEYVLQLGNYPDSLDAFALLESVSLDTDIKNHIAYLFKMKQQGFKDLPFKCGKVTDERFKDFPKEEKIDYSDVLKHIVFS